MAVLSILYGQVLRGIGAGSRTFEYINVKPTIPVKGGQLIPPGHLKGQIEFKNVYFRYPSRHEHSVLEDLNLKVESGKVVALCGPSGSGELHVLFMLLKLSLLFNICKRIKPRWRFYFLWFTVTYLSCVF